MGLRPFTICLLLQCGIDVSIWRLRTWIFTHFIELDIKHFQMLMFKHTFISRWAWEDLIGEWNILKRTMVVISAIRVQTTLNERLRCTSCYSRDTRQCPVFFLFFFMKTTFVSMGRVCRVFVALLTQQISLSSINEIYVEIINSQAKQTLSLYVWEFLSWPIQ